MSQLRDDAVPDFDGDYHCYLDNTTLLDLFQDPDFKHLYSGQAGSDAFRNGQVIRLLGVAFITTTITPPTSNRTPAAFEPQRREHRHV